MSTPTPLRTISLITFFLLIGVIGSIQTSATTIAQNDEPIPVDPLLPRASLPRGFYSEPHPVALSSATAATILYTLDGSEPTDSNGIIYTVPLTITQTTTLRIAGIDETGLRSAIETFTYIFVADVLDQGTPDGWPTAPINEQLFDYGMDPDVVAPQRDLVKQSLLNAPSLSIVTDQDNLFDPATGIYVNAFAKGREWERPTSIEWLNADNSPGFQIDAGLRIRGGFSRQPHNPKHAFRLFFRKSYDGTLKYSIFGEDGVDTFKKLDLRTSQNYSWSLNAHERTTFLREVWSRDTQAAMGNPYTRSNYVHLYINGHYWGLFMTQERVSEEYAEDYFGGKEDDYDVIKHYRIKESEDGASNGTNYVTAGNDAGWIDLWTIVQNQIVNDSEYQQIEAQVDLDSLIDDQLLHMYTGDYDAVLGGFWENLRANNWYALRDRTGDSTKWRFFAHDAEHSLGAHDHRVNAHRVGPFPVLEENEFYNVEYFNPQWLHQALTSNEQYRNRFRYRAWKHLVEVGGALTPTEARRRWDARKVQVSSVILAESARWGDARVKPPRGLSHWQNEVKWVETVWFPERSEILLAQLQAQDLASASQPLAPITPTPPAAKMILNEYNAVDGSEFLKDARSDSYFGTVQGNGGDWFELVTVVDNLDIRGWTLEIWDADNFAQLPRRTDIFKFADQPLLSALRRGTIVTVAEEVADDPSYDPAGGDWAINLQTNSEDSGVYFTAETQSNFDTNNKSWQLVIRDAAGNLLFGPAGEGTSTLTGVGDDEIGQLIENPSAFISKESAYNSGALSTFGAPNSWSDGTVTQDFAPLRSVVQPDTPTPTVTSTPTETPTATSTPTPVPTNTPVPVLTNTPVPVATNTPVPVATNTSVPLPTNTPTLLPTATLPSPLTNTPVPAATNTPVPVVTNTPVPVATNTPVPLPNAPKSTDVPTPTDTPAATNTSTSMPTNTSVPVSTNTPVPLTTNTSVPRPTPIPDLRPTITPSILPTNTAVPVSTNTPVPLPDTPMPTDTLVPTETPTTTSTPRLAPTNTPVPVLTNTPVPALTNTPVPVATNTPVPLPTYTPTALPTATLPPLPTNTPVPVLTSTPVPVATNTPVPVATNTSVPLPASTLVLLVSIQAELQKELYLPIINVQSE